MNSKSFCLKQLHLLVFFISLTSFLMAQPVSQTFNLSGSYTVPAGYTATIKVEAWGGGGGGGGNTRAEEGAGGGGGAYASKTLSNLAAGNYIVVVGKGGAGAVRDLINGPNTPPENGGNSTFGNALVVANGGNAGGGEIGGGGGYASTGAGYTSWPGGNGGNINTAWNSFGFGGGGGGSATSTAAGGNGSIPSSEGGAGGSGAGSGGKGGYSSSNPTNGAEPGGGGGGKASARTHSGNGAPGRVVVTVTGYKALPVAFGSITAKVADNKIWVHFTTLQETNNSHFNIQLSENGIDFLTATTVRSKHINGTYTAPTDYKISIDITGQVAIGFSFATLAALGVCALSRRRMIVYLFVLLSVAACLLTISCSRGRDNIAIPENSQAYLRIQQVDINGHSAYSKVIGIAKD